MHTPFNNQLNGTINLVSTLYFLLFTFIISPGAASQCPPVYNFTGKTAEDNFGWSVASAGDVNNDGYDDVIVGAPFNNAGRAYVFSGRTSDTLYIFTGEAASDRFGISVASAGDVNNDGYADMIVGADLNDAGAHNAGRAYVFSGQNGDTLHVFTGEAGSDLFGGSVASAGDVDSDGYADLIVGAGFSDAGGFNAGRAYVFSGRTGATLHVFTGGEAGSARLGGSVASAGDVNNDGYDDVIISAAWRNAEGETAGRAYVFSGPTGDTLHVFTGPAADLLIRWSVASAGDVNNDGYDDLIVGGNWIDADINRVERVYVFSGLNGETLYVFNGGSSGDSFGSSVASAGDTNGDGYADLIVGAPFNSDNVQQSGRVYIFSGFDGDTLHIFTGEVTFNFLGGSVASAGDVNGDGFADLIIGAGGNGAGFFIPGNAYVYSGRPCGAVIRIPADQPTIQAGIDAAVPGDTVLVAAGTYTGNGNRDLDFHGKGIVLNSENGPEVTIIDCQGDSLDHHRGVDFHSQEDSSAVVEGFTITGGYASAGAGIYSRFGANPQIRGNIIRANTAIDGGAGIYCHGDSTQLIIDNIITDNTIFIKPSYRAAGAGILCEWRSNPRIIANTISGNSGLSGAGIYCEQYVRATITDNFITRNFASGPGGGIYYYLHSEPDIVSNTISGNSATEGGGIYSSVKSKGKVFNNIISGNVSDKGGGVYCFHSDPEIVQNIFERNMAPTGGAIYSLGATPSIRLNTFVFNNAQVGSVMHVRKTSPVPLPAPQDCIMAYNTGGEVITYEGVDTVLPTEFLQCCDLYGNESGDWVGRIADQANINGNFSADPLFCDTAYGDYHIDGFSPCAAPFSPCGSLVGALGVGCDLGFVCGDINGDSQVNSADMFAIVDFYFHEGTAPFPLGVGNVNCTDEIDLADVMYLIYYLNGAIPELCCLNTPAPPDRQRIYTEQVDSK